MAIGYCMILCQCRDLGREHRTIAVGGPSSNNNNNLSTSNSPLWLLSRSRVVTAKPLDALCVPRRHARVLPRLGRPELATGSVMEVIETKYPYHPVC